MLAGVTEPTLLADGPVRPAGRVEAEVDVDLRGPGPRPGHDRRERWLAAAWGVLLGRVTGRSDVVFGSTVSGRGGDLPGMDTMVGLLINTVPARVRWPRRRHPGRRAARFARPRRPRWSTTSRPRWPRSSAGSACPSCSTRCSWSRTTRPPTDPRVDLRVTGCG